MMIISESKGNLTTLFCGGFCLFMQDSGGKKKGGNVIIIVLTVKMLKGDYQKAKDFSAHNSKSLHKCLFFVELLKGNSTELLS